MFGIKIKKNGISELKIILSMIMQEIRLAKNSHIHLHNQN